jgi:hypothetical protein
MSEMPYKPITNGCDLCGRSAPLSRVVLAAGSKSKLERVVYMCDQHPGTAGAPVPVPAGRVMPGTSAVRLQDESLFG